MSDIKLYQGDCLEVMKDIPAGSIDMICTDLPYGTTACAWDIVIPFEPLWEQYERIIKDNGAILLFGQDKFSAKLMLSNESLHRYNLIWQKTTPTGFLNANRMPLRIHEDILVFYKSLPTYNPQKTIGHERKISKVEHHRTSKLSEDYNDYKFAGYDSTERFPTSVLEFSTDRQKISLHPTQKPVALLQYLIKTYTNESDTVLDNCMGSGSTGVAAKILNRNFIGIELDDNYFKIAEERINAAIVGENESYKAQKPIPIHKVHKFF